MRSWRWMYKAAGLVALVAVIGGAGVFASRSGGGVVDDDARYRLATADRKPFLAVVRASGTLQPISQVLVGSQVSGRVLEILVKPNDRVVANQTVARISSEQIRSRHQGLLASLEQARAEVALKEAKAELMTLAIERAKLQVLDSEAKLTSTRLAHEIAARQWDRRRELAARGVVSAADLDSLSVQARQAEAMVASAEAQLATARSNVAAAEQELEVAKREIVAARSAVEVQRARANETAVELAYTEIVAPVTGVILQRNVELGQTVAASFATPTLFTIAENINRMELHLVLDESAVKRVRLGQRVMFTVPAHPTREFTGVIKTIRLSPQMNQNVVTYTALVDVANPDEDLFPGMSATARIVTDEVPSALVVPNAALRWRPSHVAANERATPTVYVLAPEGLPRAVPIQIGTSDGSVTTITSGGIEPGDRLIIGTSMSTGGPRISVQ
jgi:HlyD family secretion protein